MGFLDSAKNKLSDAVAGTDTTPGPLPDPDVVPSGTPGGEPIPAPGPGEPTPSPSPSSPGIPTDPGNPATG